MTSLGLALVPINPCVEYFQKLEDEEVGRDIYAYGIPYIKAEIQLELLLRTETKKCSSFPQSMLNSYCVDRYGM